MRATTTTIYQVSDSDFEGRYFWIRDAEGRALIKAAGSMQVCLPPWPDGPYVTLTNQDWQASVCVRTKAGKRRRFATPGTFLGPLTTSSSSTVDQSGASQSSTSPLPELDTSDGVDVLLYSTAEVRASMETATLDMESVERALLDYARLLADQRWGPRHRPDPRALYDAYRDTLLGPLARTRRLFALLFTVHFILGPWPWLTRHRAKQSARIAVGVDESYPPCFSAFFAAEESIVRAQCRVLCSTVGASGRVQALVASARKAYPEVLRAPRVVEQADGTYWLDVDMRLMGQFPLGQEYVSAADLCCHLLPALHAHAVKDDVLVAIRKFAMQASSHQNERTLRAALDPDMLRNWDLAASGRVFIYEALECAEAVAFFLGRGHELGPSAFPALVTAEDRARRERVRASAMDQDGHWRRPVGREEHLARFEAVALDIEDLVTSGPPCVRAVMQKLRTQRRLVNDDRYPLATWLANCFRTEVSPDRLFGSAAGQMAIGSTEQVILTQLAYVRKQVAYAPFSCYKIIGRDATMLKQSGVAITCPYAALPSPYEAKSACTRVYAQEHGIGKLATASPQFITPLDVILYAKEMS